MPKKPYCGGMCLKMLWKGMRQPLTDIERNNLSYYHSGFKVKFLEAALDKMAVPATPFFFRVHFPVVNPKIKTYTLILGFEKIAKFAPDRVCRGLGMSPLFLLLEPGGL